MRNKTTEVSSVKLRRKPEGVYATHEKESLLFCKAMVNGQLSAAYVKDGKLISYEPMADLITQIYSGKCLEFTTA